MTDILNTEYITINKDGVFVGEKPATTYRGKHIYCLDAVRDYFSGIQGLNKNVVELHILSSETSGTSLKSGKPSRKHGKYPWCRVKFDNGNVGPWVPDSSYEYSSASNCAYYCVRYGALNVCQNVDFRSAVFGAANEKQNELTNALKDTDLSKFIGAHTIGAYEIVVRKSGQNTRG